MDPITKDYPWYSPYQFAGNTPIQALDLDGAEPWYYRGAMGFTQSLTVSGPFNPVTMNKLGYFTEQQVHHIQQEEKALVQDRKEIAQYRVKVEANIEYNRSQNPFYGIYQISPIPSAIEAAQNYSDGQYMWGGVNTAFALLGISELRGIGAVGKAMSTAAIWREGNFLRGTLMEYRLSQTIYKGFEHLSETVSPFFRTIDFYDEAAQVGNSLKTVNAKENFVFQNIRDNIDALVAAKNAGSISSNGAERTLKSVRLDIVIPKGYDKSVFKEIGNFAKQNKIPLNIIEQ